MSTPLGNSWLYTPLHVAITLQDLFPVPEEMCKKCHKLIAVSELKKNTSPAVAGIAIIEDEFLHMV